MGIVHITFLKVNRTIVKSRLTKYGTKCAGVTRIFSRAINFREVGNRYKNAKLKFMNIFTQHYNIYVYYKKKEMLIAMKFRTIKIVEFYSSEIKWVYKFIKWVY